MAVTKPVFGRRNPGTATTPAQTPAPKVVEPEWNNFDDRGPYGKSPPPIKRTSSRVKAGKSRKSYA